VKHNHDYFCMICHDYVSSTVNNKINNCFIHNEKENNTLYMVISPFN
jgi:hypothetical protein